MQTPPSADVSEAPFELGPFPGDPAPAGLTIAGHASRDGDRLTLRYALSGTLQEMRLQDPGPTAERRDGLWQTTCLECFAALPGDPGYWEVNLAPSGAWNIYRLDGYRRNLRPEPACGAPSLRRLPRPDGLDLVMELRLPTPLATAAVLELGITAVIASRRGELSYWALRHPGEQADFHRREGFALRL